MNTDQFADPLCCCATRFNSRLHRSDVTTDHNGNQTAANKFFTHEMHVRRLYHRVRCLDGSDQSSGFNKS